MSQLNDYSAQFVRRLNRYRSCCVRIEQEFLRRQLKVTDVELVYSSSFLAICAHWESLLVNMLCEAVAGEESVKSSNRRFVTFQKQKHLEELLLFPRKSYVSLPTLKHAEDLSALFIKAGRPISAVSERNRTLLEQASRIRNAIAHQSRHAAEMFQSGVPGVRALARSKRTPGAFLRHEFRTSPSQRRFELYFAAYQSAALEIAAAW